MIPRVQSRVKKRTIDVYVEDFGAIGNGNNDSAAFQAAVDYCVARECPANIHVSDDLGFYRVGDVEIAAMYPINFIGSSSQMHGDIGGANTHTNKCRIAPPLGGCSYIFKWTRHAAFPTVGYGQGGSLVGVSLMDIDEGDTARRANTITTSALWLHDVAGFRVEDCIFSYLKGTAYKHERGIYNYLERTRVIRCGDTGKPSLDIGNTGPVGESYAYCFANRVFVENTYHTVQIRVSAAGLLRWHDCYVEQLNDASGLPAGGAVHIDGTGGNVGIDAGMIQNTLNTSVILAGTQDYIKNVTITSPHGTNPALIINTSGWMNISNVTIRGIGNPTGRAIQCNSRGNMFTGVTCIGNGGIESTVGQNRFQNITIWEPKRAAGQYSIDLAAGDELDGYSIEGESTAVCHGVRLAQSSALNGRITGLVNANGITPTHAKDKIKGNTITNIGTGQSIVPFAGACISDNHDDKAYYAFAGSGQTTVTLNRQSGLVGTQPDLSLAPGAAYIFDILNSLITVDSHVFLQQDTAGGATGLLGIVAVEPYAGGVAVQVLNLHSSATATGVHRFHFFVLQN